MVSLVRLLLASVVAALAEARGRRSIDRVESKIKADVQALCDGAFRIAGKARHNYAVVAQLHEEIDRRVVEAYQLEGEKARALRTARKLESIITEERAA